ncbi:MAG TPA: hypothetical protein PLD37_14455 [Usitatibacteraceae bacterium]|nr:hypothetical protein [Usitatibacteraceae bacterium]
MPYFVYKVFAFHRLECVGSHEAFPEASKAAKALRADPAIPADCRVRVIFAEDAFKAELLLTEVREPQPRTPEDD